jgi:hypothetical protein
LKDTAFRWWRQELSRRDLEPSITPGGERPETAPAFLSVRVVDPEAVAIRIAPPIEIVLPTGPTVRVSSGFDSEQGDEGLRPQGPCRWHTGRPDRIRQGRPDAIEAR